ncbi:MAG TPA: cytochrome c oxidase subunit 3 [Chitinophagales bacterium]|nr:cytochrome c oxidase subunit 3 [Chitinophagales bacterium]HMW12888.1 cytochrome c oxidase subunit 3 [Chitinophagales bacterium]HMX59078.1 cytochrome c oxidase subunit 3 [Chitinophagales bacterium]HMY22910.1 cytochrome c oxidase subunit 3 [Chitinophagales bacterium]HMZ33931.1 cytochrome c oxidase subunit 3 [Chitinophagales bacterium]
MNLNASLKYKVNNQGAHRFTMYLFIITTSMIFAGFTSAFLVRKGVGGAWSSFGIPSVFIISTVLILLSSVCLHLAHLANKKQNNVMTTIGLFATLVLGALFCYFQIQGWKALNDAGVYLSFNPNPAGPYFLVITFVHAVHVIFGLLFLLIAFFHSLLLLRRKESTHVIDQIESSEKGIFIIRTDLLTLFWHFMGILWVYLYFFLTFNLK